MSFKEQTKLNILLNVLSQKYSGYYYDFSSEFKDDENIDNIVCLMGNLKNLKGSQKEYEYYIPYLKNCFAIYSELVTLVNDEFYINKKNHVSLMISYIKPRQREILELFGEWFVYEKEKVDAFCEVIKNDESIFFADMVVDVIRSYQSLKNEENRILMNLKSYSKFFEENI